MTWAQKFRPRVFEDLKGQDTTVTILKNLLQRYADTGILHNCIILQGSYGSGKTSTAKILGNYLNCEKGPLTACGQCKSCIDIRRDAHTDIIEVDAASYSGKQDIKNIQVQLQYSVIGKYRVVILDEAHQLSSAAWDALLKTLEEPKTNQLFILATTEASKIPKTIVSRALTLSINTTVSVDAIERLAYIANVEGVNISKSLLKDVLMLTGGHMRDAIQLIEMSTLVTETNTEITLSTLYSSLGMCNVKNLDDFVNFFYQNNYQSIYNFLGSFTGDIIGLLKSCNYHIYKTVNDSKSADIMYKKLILLEVFEKALIDYGKNSMPTLLLAGYLTIFNNKLNK